MRSNERLHKMLARAGIASRRHSEELIRAGRVRVNGQVVRDVGTQIDPQHDQVQVDGQAVQVAPPLRYIMLHKPPGVVSTAHDPQGRPTVLDLVRVPLRIFPVGRLDADSQGLLLLTNDGDLTHHLTHPRFAVEKEYHALLTPNPTTAMLEQWCSGVLLEGKRTAPAQVSIIERSEGGAWLRVVLREGRKRQIREVARLLGYTVQQLIRVREGTLHLGTLPVGAWRDLHPDEVAALRAHLPHPQAAQQ
jgi:23S rRNA pseudouridine2605 synthase